MQALFVTIENVHNIIAIATLCLVRHSGIPFFILLLPAPWVLCLCVYMCACALLHVHAECVSVCVLRFGLFLCPTFMIILCVCVSFCCLYFVCMFVSRCCCCWPLLAMTGDVDAMCTIHFGVSFVRFFLFLFRSFLVSFAAVAILFLRLLSVSACCFSLLYYAFYLLFDCDCLSVCAGVCVCWSGFIFDWILCMYWIFLWLGFLLLLILRTKFFLISCGTSLSLPLLLLVSPPPTPLLVPRSTVQRVERSMRSFLSFTIIAFNSLELTLVSDVLLLILLLLLLLLVGVEGAAVWASAQVYVAGLYVHARASVCVFVCIVFRMFRKMTNV